MRGESGDGGNGVLARRPEEHVALLFDIHVDGNERAVRVGTVRVAIVDPQRVAGEDVRTRGDRLDCVRDAGPRLRVGPRVVARHR